VSGKTKVRKRSADPEMCSSGSGVATQTKIYAPGLSRREIALANSHPIQGNQEAKRPLPGRIHRTLAEAAYTLVVAGGHFPWDRRTETVGNRMKYIRISSTVRTGCRPYGFVHIKPPPVQGWAPIRSLRFRETTASDLLQLTRIKVGTSKSSSSTGSSWDSSTWGSGLLSTISTSPPLFLRSSAGCSRSCLLLLILP